VDLFRLKEKSLLSWRIIPVLVMAVLLVGITGLTGHSAQPKQQETFNSPEAAFKAMMEALRAGNSSRLVRLFGPWEKAFFSDEARLSGQTLDQFLKEYGEKNRLEKIGKNRVVLHVGPEDWPWPIPAVKVGSRWRFDVEKGKKEILARRIGGDEVAAVQVCLAYGDAQHEYAREHPTTKGMGEYAQKFMSDEGKENGLCWVPGKEKKQSPIGPLLANACQIDYSGTRPKEKSAPYYGYYYKILTRQGKDAPGGAYDYIVDGKMVGGFALVAYPAFYGKSGIMTFIVNQEGQVYEKNLGGKTREIAAAMEEFNPDKTWKKVD
jgi:Protein of unknown function (DUF2950)